MPTFGLRRSLAALAGVAALATLAVTMPAQANISPTPKPAAKPTIVLVHGAFADASGWNGVITRLERDGYPVVAVANPLRSPSSDAAYVHSFLATIKGPTILVGHSYGGAVITEAAAGDPQVKALVYIAAFMPDTGEVLGDLGGRFPGSELGPALVQTPVPGGGVDLSIDPAQFHKVFAADVPAGLAAQMAAAQRPLSAGAFAEPITDAAWHTIPSWFLIATQDKAISPDLERYEAARAHSHAVEIPSSHAAMVSHPDETTHLIEQAAKATA